MIYLAAVVHDRQDADHTPYVSTPVGPYQPDETDAIERGRSFLRAAYATEDIRRFDTTELWQDMDTARGSIQGTVAMEAYERREARDARRAQDAVNGMTDEQWQDVGVTYDTTARRLLAEDGDASFRPGGLPGVTAARSFRIAMGELEDLDEILAVLGVNPRDV